MLATVPHANTLEYTLPITHIVFGWSPGIVAIISFGGIASLVDFSIA